MKWTHKLPTQAGWYWSKFYNPKAPGASVRIVYIAKSKHGKLLMNNMTLEELQCCFGERRWAGPLYPPSANAYEPEAPEEEEDEDIDA